MGRMKYVQRRANRFGFRYQMPDDVAGKPYPQPYPQPWPESLGWCINPKTGRFKTEIVRSLKTADSRTAERAALPLIEEAHRLVDIARQVMASGPASELSSDLIAALAAEHAATTLARDEEIRNRGVPGIQRTKERVDCTWLQQVPPALWLNSPEPSAT